MQSPGEVGRPLPSVERSVAELDALACLKTSWFSNRALERTGSAPEMLGGPTWPTQLNKDYCVLNCLSLTKKRHQKENAMSHLHIIRAWKDAEYRLSLSDAERPTPGPPSRNS